MPATTRLLPILVLVLPLSGCALVGAGLVGGGSGYDREAIEALRQDCEMKSGELAIGKYIRVECFDPERWR